MDVDNVLALGLRHRCVSLAVERFYDDAGVVICAERSNSQISSWRWSKSSLLSNATVANETQEKPDGHHGQDNDQENPPIELNTRPAMHSNSFASIVYHVERTARWIVEREEAQLALVQ